MCEVFTFFTFLYCGVCCIHLPSLPHPPQTLPHRPAPHPPHRTAVPLYRMQLVFTFPEDAKTSTGSLFWSPPKRCGGRAGARCRCRCDDTNPVIVPHCTPRCAVLLLNPPAPPPPAARPRHLPSPPRPAGSPRRWFSARATPRTPRLCRRQPSSRRRCGGVRGVCGEGGGFTVEPAPPHSCEMPESMFPCLPLTAPCLPRVIACPSPPAGVWHRCARMGGRRAAARDERGARRGCRPLCAQGERTHRDG